VTALIQPGDDWARMPYRGTLCGIKRGKLARLAVPSPANKFKPPVRSVALREPGQKRATRLIYLPSLNAHLNKLADEQAKDAAKKARTAK
jgi:hypothetical protein